MKIHTRTVELIDASDFIKYFKSILPEWVDEEAFGECIADSEVTFGSNSDTLLELTEGLRFLIEAAPECKEALTERFNKLYDELDELYSMDDVYISLGC